MGTAARVFPPVKQFVSYYNSCQSHGRRHAVRHHDVPIRRYWPYLTWNPVLHCMEMLREGWFVTYTSPVADPDLCPGVVLGLLLLGLSLERYQRRMPYV